MPIPEFPRRDGSIVHDPRLGRLVSPESEQQRCMAYPLRTEQDRKPIHKVWTVPYLLDQWYSPMCVGFAVAHRLIAAGLQLGRGDAERIYREAQKYDLFPGEGYAGTTIIGGAVAAYQLGYVKRFSWASTLEDLILGVGHSGPAIMGTNWYKAMDTPAINGGVRPDGRNNGGHAYLIYGVVPEGRMFLCANSWGEWYGIQGRFVVTFDDMDRLLTEKGEACFFKEVVKK